MIKWTQGIIRNVMLFTFYATPLGWIYLIANAYLDIMDWLTLPCECKRIEKKKDDSASLTTSMFAIGRIFRTRSVVSSD